MKKLLEASQTVILESNKVKTVHRKTRLNDFTILPNRLLKDKRLSFKARGILAMMLAMPEDWQTYASWIEDQGTEGREALQSAFKELEKYGYLSRQRVLDPVTKKFTCYQWSWFDEPYDGMPSAGFPADGKTAATKTITYKEKTNKETKESSPNALEDDGGDLKPVWKPSPGSKELKLSLIRPPDNYPAEHEFDRLVSSEGLDAISTYRPDLYADLCAHKWHSWKEKSRKWVPIVDWRKFVCGLDDHIRRSKQKSR